MADTNSPITNPVKGVTYPGLGALDPEAPPPAERPMNVLTRGPQPGDHQRHPFFDNKGGDYYKKHPERSGYLGRSI